jgi:hypothetical protein
LLVGWFGCVAGLGKYLSLFAGKGFQFFVSPSKIVWLVKMGEI